MNECVLGVLDSQTHCGLCGCSRLGEAAGLSSLSRPLVLSSYQCPLYSTHHRTVLTWASYFFRAGSYFFPSEAPSTSPEHWRCQQRLLELMDVSLIDTPFNTFFQRSFSIIFSTKPLKTNIILTSRSQPLSLPKEVNFGVSNAEVPAVLQSNFRVDKVLGFFPPTPPPFRPTRASPGVAERGAFKEGAEHKWKDKAPGRALPLPLRRTTRTVVPGCRCRRR